MKGTALRFSSIQTMELLRMPVIQILDRKVALNLSTVFRNKSWRTVLESSLKVRQNLLTIRKNFFRFFEPVEKLLTTLSVAL
jgi:hypothetical protein